jgi:hypothetical protein
VKPIGPYSTRKLPVQPVQLKFRLAEVGEFMVRVTFVGTLHVAVNDPNFTGSAVPLMPQFSATQTSYIVPAVKPEMAMGNVGRQAILMPVPTMGAVDGLGKIQYSVPLEQFPPGVQLIDAEVGVAKLVTKLVGFGQLMSCHARVKLPSA